MKIKMGIIGGGQGSFIGPVHIMSARMDSRIELVSGAFSSDPQNALESGKSLYLNKERIYTSWEEMLKKESQLPETDRPDFISIVTPNYLHHSQVIASLKSGFHVICDKPLCMTADEAHEIREEVLANDKLFCITHNYSGYPMIKKARELIMNGELGSVRKVAVEYFQGWLTEKEEEKGNRQAEWRADPSRAGMAGCMADIGTHAFQLSEYLSGREVKKLFAQLNRVVEGRLLDDDGNVLLQFEDGITGSLLASQVATGEENNLRIRIYGSEGSITWEQMNPNNLIVRGKNKPMQVFRTATGYPEIGKYSNSHARIPAGHPEGFIEAFANLYRNFALAILAGKEGKQPDRLFDFPGIEDGVRGMKFLEAVVQSSKEDRWVTL